MREREKERESKRERERQRQREREKGGFREIRGVQYKLLNYFYLETARV